MTVLGPGEKIPSGPGIIAIRPRLTAKMAAMLDQYIALEQTWRDTTEDERSATEAAASASPTASRATAASAGTESSAS